MEEHYVSGRLVGHAIICITDYLFNMGRKRNGMIKDSAIMQFRTDYKVRVIM
ncbi:MAG TPA: hypothetical protein VE593_03420 [Nitrososphaeraceae archaeon]|nr:hypothetical protein [Nitrososphaeraceae archaeon]